MDLTGWVACFGMEIDTECWYAGEVVCSGVSEELVGCGHQHGDRQCWVLDVWRMQSASGGWWVGIGVGRYYCSIKWNEGGDTSGSVV